VVILCRRKSKVGFGFVDEVRMTPGVGVQPDPSGRHRALAGVSLRALYLSGPLNDLGVLGASGSLLEISASGVQC
jgi:hypothetical protein